MSDAAAPPAAADHGKLTPLSVLQEQLWYFTQLSPDIPVYNEMFAIYKDGPLDVDALRSAFTELVRRHEILRSTFGEVDSVPMQRVHPPPTWALPLVDLSGMSRPDAEQEATRMAIEDTRPPFDLTTGPLIRPRLVRIAADHHRLYLGLHHIIFDGASLNRVILPELVALYDDFAAGRAPSLPESPIQYADFASWSRDGRYDSEFPERVAYWRQHLTGAPTLELPIDKPRPTHQSFRGRMVQLFAIPKAQVDELRALSHGNGASMFQALTSAFVILLQRCTGNDDIVLGTVADLRGRYYGGVESMVGYCVTPLVLRADLRDDPSFLEVLRRVRAELRAGLDHLVPFEGLVRELQPHRDRGVNPIFQAMMVMQPANVSTDALWTLCHMDAKFGTEVGTVKFDLSVEFDEMTDGVLYGRLGYNTDLFEPESAQRLAARWGPLVTSILAAPARPVSELLILSDEERNRQLVEWNQTEVEYPRATCLHELTAEQARRTPDAVVSDGLGGRLTFAELDDRAGRLASRLRELEVGPETLVGICMQRSTDLVVALLGVLKAGGAFVPLDPDQPHQRLVMMLSEARPSVVITTDRDRGALPTMGARIVCLDRERDDWMSRPAMVATECGPDNLAYVLFTSGSSGSPKGVMVEHSSLINQLLWKVDILGLSAADRLLQKTPLGFDPAVGELFYPLLTGASLTLLAPGDHADPRRLWEVVRDERITVVGFVPSMLEGFIAAADPVDLGSLRLVTAGGETISPGLVRSFFTRFGPAVELRNLYGPTEATLCASSWRCDPSSDGTVPIGRPVANTQIYLLDANLNPVPIGAPGELCIGGVQVARGYVNRPELTAERFVPNPFRAGERLYRTGDIARHRNDGAIEFLGRRDGQVKIRGVRIELGEIEAAMARHPDVRQAVAALRDDGERQRRLVAYILPPGAGRAPNLAEMRAFLSDSLPSSMLPSALMVVDSIPFTHSGKLDRGALPDPDLRPVTTFRPPRSVLETRLAALWARMLKVPQVGIDDDFFELGGHSLLAVRLLGRVEAEFRVAISLSAFLEGSATVARMASAVQSRADAGRLAEPTPSPVTTPVLFFVEPGESGMLTLRHFARALGPAQKVVGLLPERNGARFDQSRSVESLAAGILRTIRATQATGPYYLAGWSIGGLLAYEIATQLRAGGDEVALLALLDAGAPAFSREAMRRGMSLTQRLARQRARGPAGSLRHTRVVATREVRAALVRLHLRPSRIGDDFDWRGAHRVASRYACPGNDAPMDLFLTARGVTESGSRSLGWEEVHQGPLCIHDVPGGHESMVSEPHVSTVAEMLSVALRRAQEAGGVRA